MILYFTNHEFIDINKVRIFGYEEKDYILFKRKKYVNYIGVFNKNLSTQWNEWTFKDGEKIITYLTYLHHNLDIYSFNIDKELKTINIKKFIRKKKLEQIKKVGE